MSQPLSTGSPAPNFELPDQQGRIVRLRDFRGHSAVVLYFYPKDDTSGCTKEACRFRDDFEKFRKAGAVVVGVSDDPIGSHERFAAKYKLPFTLLSDTGGKVRSLYGVTKTFGFIPGRVTFVIDRQGVVRSVFSSLTEAERHVDEALNGLKAT